MKEFKKNDQGLFLCEECGRTYNRLCDLSKHINLKHISIQVYFDKWLKEKRDGICKICSKPTKWNGRLSNGYRNCCSEKCLNKYTDLRSKESLTKKYGVDSPLKVKSIQEKIKQTNLEKYGVEYLLQSKEIRDLGKKNNLEKYRVENNFQRKEVRKKAQDTMLKRHGVKFAAQNKEIYEKNKKTCKEKYGTEYTFQSREIIEKGKETKKVRYDDENFNNMKKNKETKKVRYDDENYNNRKKSKETCLEKYGVEYSMQNVDTFEKAQKTRFLRHRFRDTNIWYQSSYELDFLKKYYDKFLDIQRAPSIKYTFEDKEHYYFPDFYILSLNLIVECKNSYLANRDKNKIKAKKKSTVANGFKYIMIVNKNYSEINRLYL